MNFTGIKKGASARNGIYQRMLTKKSACTRTNKYQPFWAMKYVVILLIFFATCNDKTTLSMRRIMLHESIKFVQYVLSFFFFLISSSKHGFGNWDPTTAKTSPFPKSYVKLQNPNLCIHFFCPFYLFWKKKISILKIIERNLSYALFMLF